MNKKVFTIMNEISWIFNKKIAIILLGLMVFSSFSTVSTLTTNSKQEQTKKVFKIGAVGDPENLNPVLAYSDLAWTLINWIYEPLVRWQLTGGDWKIVPGLAESWDIASNGTQIVFHLVHNATWSDGVPVTAADVNWTIFTWTFLGYWRASSPHFDHYGINVIDNYTIALNLVDNGYENIYESTATSPYYRQLDWYNNTPTKVNIEGLLMGLPYMPILPEHIWDPITWNDPVFGVNGTFYSPYGFWNYLNWDGISWRILNLQLDGKPFVEPRIGCGPWIFESWTPGDKIVFKANKNYMYGAPKVDEIDIIIYSSVETATQAVLSGDIDFTTTSITFAQLGNFPSSIGQIRNDFMGFEALFINQNVAYLNKTQAGTSGAKHMALLDQTVRKAIHQAINMDRINQIAFLGSGVVTDSVIHKSLSWYNDHIIHFVNGTDAAVATLQADGWFKNSAGLWEKDVGGPVNETLSFNLKYDSGNPVDFTVTNLIKEDLGAAGIKVNIIPEEPTTFTSDMGACTQFVTSGCWNYDMAVSFYTETGDPTYMNFYLTSDSLINLNGINISRVDQIFHDEQITSDDTQRKALIDEFQQIIYNDSSIIPMVNFKDIEIYRADQWKFQDTVAQSGMFSLYNTFAFRFVDVAPTGSSSSTSSASSTTSSTKLPASSPGFLFIPVLLLIGIISFKRRKKM